MAHQTHVGVDGSDEIPPGPVRGGGAFDEEEGLAVVQMLVEGETGGIVSCAALDGVDGGGGGAGGAGGAGCCSCRGVCGCGMGVWESEMGGGWKGVDGEGRRWGGRCVYFRISRRKRCLR